MRTGHYYTADRIVCTDGGYATAPVLLNGGRVQQRYSWLISVPSNIETLKNKM